MMRFSAKKKLNKGKEKRKCVVEMKKKKFLKIVNFKLKKKERKKCNNRFRFYLYQNWEWLSIINFFLN